MQTDILRQYIRHAINEDVNSSRKFTNSKGVSQQISNRISGFVDEVVELSKEIASGRDESIKQLKWLTTEIKSIVQFFERNEEKLAEVAFKHLLTRVEELNKITSFWNRPKVIGRKAYLEKVKECVQKVLHQAGISKHLMSRLKVKKLDNKF